MVRKCVYDDLNQMIELAFRKNNNASHFSAFCSCKCDQIQEEFAEELNSKEMFEYMKSLENVPIRYTFYFGKRNTECISFMELIGAENQENEFQLLKKMGENFLQSV